MPTTGIQDLDSLLGTWCLSTGEGRADDGSIMLPYGEKPEGTLIYSADGKVMVIIMKPDRPLFASNDPLKGTDQEVREAFEGFQAYCGRFDLDMEAGTVTHHVEQSWYPNLIGTQQVRFVSLKEGRLSLTTPPFLAAGKEFTFYWNWNR
jgi:hypothetical protein